MENKKVRGFMLKILDVLFKYNVFIFLIYINISILYLNKITNLNTNTRDALLILVANIFLIIGTYTLNKISDEKEDIFNGYGELKVSSRKNIALTILSFLFFLSSLILYLIPKVEHLILFWFILFSLGVLYSYPRKYRLKNIFLIKNITSAFCWFFSIIILLLVSINGLNIIKLMYSLSSIFLLVLIIEIIWDLPDINGDKEAKINTLPAIFGFKKAKIIILILLTLMFLFFSTFLNKILCLFLFIFVLNVTQNTHKKTYHYLIFLMTLIIFLFILFQ